MTATTTATRRPGTRPQHELPMAVPRLGPIPRCPRCATVLDGGPVAYHCARCGRGVMAADIDTEYHPPGPARAGAATGGGP